MTVTVTCVRTVPRGALPTRLVIRNSTHPPALWNARVAWRAAAVGAVAGGLLGILTALAVFRGAQVEAVMTYAATGYAAGTVLGALLGLALGAAAGAGMAAAARLRHRHRVTDPAPLWVRHRSA